MPPSHVTGRRRINDAGIGGAREGAGRQCGAAIIVFTPDEELRNLDGKRVWRSSQNVVHELGATGVVYGNRIVIFRAERVDLAANYSDVGHITFMDGDLRAKAIELFREL